MTRIRIAGGYRRAGLAAATLLIAALTGCQATPRVSVPPVTALPVPAASAASLHLESPLAPSGSAPPAVEPGPGLARFDGPGWSFDYPISWTRYDRSPESAYSYPFGFLTDQQLDEARACDDTEAGLRCQIGPLSGRPGGVLMELSRDGCAYGCIHSWDPLQPGYRLVDGVPATAYRSTDSNNAYLAWEIADPENAGTFFRVAARVRGPGTEAGVRAVEQAMATWRFDPPILPLDPAEAPALVSRIVRERKVVDPTYACVPESTGETRTARVTKLHEYELTRPLDVTCSVSIHIESRIYWLVRLKVAWEAQGGSKANADVLRLWLTRAGLPSWGSDRNARPPYCCANQ